MTTAHDMIEVIGPAIKDCFDASPTLHAPLLPGSAQALLAWTITARLGRPVVLVTDGPHALESMHQNLRTLSPIQDGDNGDPNLLYFPPRESASPDLRDHDLEMIGSRLQTLTQLTPIAEKKPPWVIATTAEALLQHTLPPDVLVEQMQTLAVDEEHEISDLAESLVSIGYVFVPEVQDKGQVAVKGGLVDVWPSVDLWPIRLEFYGNSIDSIRTFDPSTQRSLDRPNGARFPPVIEKTSVADATAEFMEYLPDDVVLMWSDIDTIREHLEAHHHRSDNQNSGNYLKRLENLKETWASSEPIFQIIMQSAPPNQSLLPLDLTDCRHISRVPRDTFEPDVMETARKTLYANLKDEVSNGTFVAIYFDTKGALEHFKKSVKPGKGENPICEVGVLSSGFSSKSLSLILLAESDVYGHQKLRGRRYDPMGDVPRPSRDGGSRISDLASLVPGELVIHVEHGLGSYRGLNEIVFEDQRQEVITIEYADEMKLHVPTTHAHLLSRYVGGVRQKATLHRLGGKRWNKEMEAATGAVADLASDLLKTQAQRNMLEGHAYPKDTTWQHEFEASFPYQETRDQLRVIEEMKSDMEAPNPMDRLVCGDAGYGKTEVAMRAAFKVAMGSRQVAILVPTTVLAQQHFQTFKDRMDAYPLRVEMLSRFCARSQHQEILAGIADGTIDIVIGTHALVQPSVRFKNLGLVIIDEEQRFGVAHKERLKQIRQLVDVLTMTATPIPRTLYMSMTGAKDMSLLQTPPSERMAIETIVARNSDSVVREAILRELNREGQVFYLHNRVRTIDIVRERLESLVPEARITVAHGQMSSGQLKEVMRSFVSGEHDVLLCTTIIESGVDIPSVNTILIDRADRFGIADLYQLRGRVGRSNHKAYAFLLLPAQGRVEQDARKRIAAVERHSGLGAGFSLAVRDLEIRGSGNLLGSQQSGHIAAVGFALYCQLLQRTIAQMKGEKVPPVIDVDVSLDFIDMAPNNADRDDAACVPYSYIDEEPLRLEAYRKLAQSSTLEDLLSLQDELSDRFGPVPKSVQTMLKIAEIRVLAFQHRIEQVRCRNKKVTLVSNGHALMKGTRFPRMKATSIQERLQEIKDLIVTHKTWS